MTPLPRGSRPELERTPSRETFVEVRRKLGGGGGRPHGGGASLRSAVSSALARNPCGFLVS